MKNFFWKKKRWLLKNFFLKKKKRGKKKNFFRKKDERWKTFFKKTSDDKWKGKNKKMSDVERKKNCQRGRWKKFCLGAWNFDWNLHFSAFRCESNTWTVSKKCHRFWLSFGVNFFGGGNWLRKKNRAMKHILLRTNI